MLDRNQYNYNIPDMIPFAMVGEQGKKINAGYTAWYMMSRTQAMFTYTGLPDTIPQREFELLLQGNGYAIIKEHEGKLYAFRAGLGGTPDVYYRPTVAVIANPALYMSGTFEIGKECVLVKSDSMLLGLLPLISKYATMLTENELSMLTTSVMSRLMSIIIAGTDKAKVEAERYLKKLADGNLAVIGDAKILTEDAIKTQPYAQGGNTVLTQLMEYQRALKGEFYNELGIDYNGNGKREALNSAEVGANNDCLIPLIDDMLRCRKEGVEAINEMFGTNITVELNSVWATTNHEAEIENEQLDAESDLIEADVDKTDAEAEQAQAEANKADAEADKADAEADVADEEIDRTEAETEDIETETEDSAEDEESDEEPEEDEEEDKEEEDEEEDK